MYRPEIIVVGFSDSSIEKSLKNCRTFGVDSEELEVETIASLPPETEMESMRAPVVVVLNASSETVFKDLDLVRNHWHFTSILICAELLRMPTVHQLLARGATDFLEIPFTCEEFTRRVAARVGAYNHRSRESTRQLGSLTINIMQRTVSNGRDTAFLTPIETKIVATLAESVGGVVQRAAMKQMCWGDMSITDNALNRKIYEVRRTLRRLSEEVNIRTIYGLGFELEMADRPRA